jgi:NPCBM/NEW2 domain/Alpha galactosidase C-terminal beta sandwich domain
LFNRNGPATNITCNWTNIGLQAGAATVRDLWAHSDLGAFTNTFTTNVPSHTAVMLKIIGTPPKAPAIGTTYLSDLQPICAYVGWGTMTKDRSIDGNPIRLGGATYSKGLGVHAFSGVEYDLGGVASRFQAVIGVDNEEIGDGPGSVDFQVYADGMRIYDSGVMYTNTPPQTINLNVNGVSRLVLGVNDGDDGINFDHADWANALVIVTNTTPVPPHAPTGLEANPGNSIELAWNATLSATGYNIKRSTNGGSSFTILGTSPVASYSDGNVVSGINYDYAISATNRFGESANSAEVSVTPCSPPAAPTNVISSVTNSNVAVSWNAVPGATGYNVARAISSAPFTTIASGLVGTTYADTNAVSGVTYYYIVTAANACNQGPPSTFVAAKVPIVPSARECIGIHFAGCQSSNGGNTPEAMAYTDVAGVIPQTNWNNVNPSGSNSGGSAQIVGPSAGIVSDNSGAATGVTFSYAAQGIWSVDQNTHTGNEQLLNGYLDVRSSANGQCNLGNIPYRLYDVYVYVSSDTDDRTAGVDINGGPQKYLLTAANGYNYSNPLIQATATAQTSASEAQYVLFQNLTGSSLQVSLNWYGQNVGLAAIQIVPSAIWLTNSWNGANVTVSWPGNGSLLQATNIAGPWTTNPAVSPVTLVPTNPQMYFRTVQ